MHFSRLEGFLFRVTSPRYRDLRQTAEMSTFHLGRFNTEEIGAVYTSREPETAIEELRRRAERDGVSLGSLHPRSLFVLDVHLRAIIDLTSAEELLSWGLTPDDLTSDDLARCQEVVAVAVQHGAEAIRWKSATGSGESLAIFIERLLPGSSIRINEEFELTRAALSDLINGVSVSDIIPAVRGFPLLPRN